MYSSKYLLREIIYFCTSPTNDFEHQINGEYRIEVGISNLMSINWNNRFSKWGMFFVVIIDDVNILWQRQARLLLGLHRVQRYKFTCHKTVTDGYLLHVKLHILARNIKIMEYCFSLHYFFSGFYFVILLFYFMFCLILLICLLLLPLSYENLSVKLSFYFIFEYILTFWTKELKQAYFIYHFIKRKVDTLSTISSERKVDIFVEFDNHQFNL